jgi:hypothetical protein
MADDCMFFLKITGSKQNIEEMVQILQAKYKNAPSDPLHLWRVHEARVNEVREVNGAVYTAAITGTCAWSVYSCMCDGPNTYQAQFPDSNGTTLRKESERLRLVIKVDSAVSRDERYFHESMLFVFGEERFFETSYKTEYWYDPAQFDTIEQFNEEYGLEATQQELADCGGYYNFKETELSRGAEPSAAYLPESEF